MGLCSSVAVSCREISGLNLLPGMVVCGTGLQLRDGKSVPAHAVLFQLPGCLCGLAMFATQMQFCAAPSVEANLRTRSEENVQAV